MYSYMNPEHAAETEATEREALRLEREHPRLKGDALLNAATEAAGYNVGESGVERCDHCGGFYHRDYGGEYVDPCDDSLLEEIRERPEFSRLRSLRRLSYAHYCDFECFLADVREGAVRWRPSRRSSHV